MNKQPGLGLSPRLQRYFSWKHCFVLLSIFIGFTMLHISKDFGITLDEDIHNNQGHNLYAYFQHKSTLAARNPLDSTGALNFQYGPNYEDLTGSLNIFGGFFDLVCVTTYKWFHFTDGEYENRHLINAFFGFLGILFAGLLARNIASWRAGVITLLFMFLSPRYIGHSMNNPKDIPFAAFYIINAFFLFKLLEELPKPKISTVIFLVIGIALGIDVRISGLLTIAYLGLFYVADIGWNYGTGKLLKSEVKPIVRSLVIIAVICILGYLGAALLWPYDRSNPFKVPLIALSKVSHFDVFNSYDLFEGRWWNRDEIPWYYVPKWLYITVPLFILLGFLLSPLLLIKIPKLSSLTPINKKKILAVSFLFAFPIVYVIAVKANIYNDARHLLFCYAPLAILCALSTENLLNFNIHRNVKLIISAVFVCLMIEPLTWMVRNHPNEVTYFSPVIGGIDGAFKKYETDYWGNSDRAAVEWIQENVKPISPDNPIRIRKWYGTKNSVDYYIRKKPGYVYVMALENSDGWDYSIVETVSCKWFQNVLFNWPPPGTVHEIKADNTPLLAIVKNFRIGHPELILPGTEAEVDANPTPEGYYRLGFLYYQVQRYADCIEANKKAIELKPDYALAYNNMAAAYGALSMWQDEIEACSQALKFDPSLALARNNLNFATSMLKSSGKKMTTDDYVNQSLEYFREKQYDKCIEACQNAIKLNPRSAVAYNNIGCCYNALGKYAEAEKACGKALELQPDFELAKNNLNLAKSNLKKGL